MGGRVELLQLPDQQEEAGVQHRAQKNEGSQHPLLQEADALQDCGHEPAAKSKRVVMVMKWESGH